MGTEVALPPGFGPLPAAFAGQAPANDEYGQGVAASYGIMGFKGKVWTARYQGQDTPLMRDDGDGPRNSIEVVLVKASPAISKIFYRAGYVDGSNAAPDCWSGNGVTPAAGVQNKVHATCADCPMNAWGSRVSEAGKPGKACSDSRRVAIVPIADMDNELFGGPMLLRIPAASLKDLKGYADLMNTYQYPVYAVVTKVSFDPKEAFPKFVFQAVRPLTDVEAQKVIELRDGQRVAAVLAENLDVTPAGNTHVAPVVPASPFLEPPAAAPAPVAAPQPVVQAPVAAPAPTPPANPFGGPVVAAPAAPVEAPAPQAAAPVQEAPAQPAAAPASGGAAPSPAAFDALLDNIIGG
jgi:hypothetical protein